MKGAKLYTMDAGSVRALLKTAARGHTKSITARRAKEAAEVGSYKRAEMRHDETREYWYARGIMFALEMLNGTKKDIRRRNPRPARKTTPTAKATA